MELMRGVDEVERIRLDRFIVHQKISGGKSPTISRLVGYVSSPHATSSAWEAERPMTWFSFNVSAVGKNATVRAGPQLIGSPVD